VHDGWHAAHHFANSLAAPTNRHHLLPSWKRWEQLSVATFIHTRRCRRVR
jgi:hypothetical protein